MENFLYCNPSVYVIGKEYEIIVNLNKFGLCYVNIDGEIFYENNSGVLPSEKNIAKFRVPQKVLNSAKKYSVVFRETEERKSYFSTFKSMKTAEFSFKPLEKTENIHIYHVADVHYRFDIAKHTVSYFGKDTDLFVVNGDIGEVETIENFKEVSAFVGEISGGEIPIIFVRGNHDTRGRLAELFTDYFPCNDKNTFYSFEIGCINGVVLDCGEDKVDENDGYDSSKDVPNEYRGINCFHEYRKKELSFLKTLEFDENKIPFAVTHICPMMTTLNKGDCFDIERDCYTKWNNELERLKINFMLCGHYHKTFIISQDDEKNIIPHNYPVVVGSACFKNDVWGSAITLNKNGMYIEFTNKDLQVMQAHKIDFVNK